MEVHNSIPYAKDNVELIRKRGDNGNCFLSFFAILHGSILPLKDQLTELNIKYYLMKYMNKIKIKYPCVGEYQLMVGIINCPHMFFSTGARNWNWAVGHKR